METIKVNMNPNPLDVQTIHASQNDGEARQWEFELHNNGELIDTSEITEQLFFKAYKGGTEQLLPENTSTPTTSPFKSDIKYPQGLLTDQEFTYRQSPSEEDGLAKITDIKGNTLVWNQLLQNGNFVSTSGWSPNIQANTITASSNELTVNINTLGANVGVYSTRLLHNRIANHKYLFKLNVYVPHATTVRFGTENEIQRNIIAGWNTVYEIVQSSITSKVIVCYITATEALGFVSGETYKIKNYQCFDLTQMGLDISNPSEFTSLFPLPYYAYNQGTLLSFNGTGLKTTGKNILVNSGFVRGVLGWNNSPSDSNIVTNNAFLTSPFIPIPQGVSQITLSAIKGSIVRYWEADSNFNGLYFDGNKPNEGQTITRTLSAGCRYIRISIGKDGLSILPSYYGTVVYGQIEFGNQASNYEPYTSSTLSLPISTYFPTGMKSAGNVYDELTESKATKRLELFEITSSNIQSNYLDTQNNQWLGHVSIPDIKQIADGTILANIICNTLETKNQGSLFGETGSAIALLVNSTNVRITIRGVTTFADMQTWLDNHETYFVYELATPTETPITTASLVTENAEIPLSNEDGILIGKCTEQLSSESGFFDAKIKLADGDGDVYSNKIQLHVERKPS